MKKWIGVGLLYYISAFQCVAQTDWNMCSFYEQPKQSLVNSLQNDYFKLETGSIDTMVFNTTVTKLQIHYANDTLSNIILETNDWSIVKAFYASNEPNGIVSNTEQMNGKVHLCNTISCIYFFEKNNKKASYRFRFYVFFEKEVE